MDGGGVAKYSKVLQGKNRKDLSYQPKGVIHLQKKVFQQRTTNNAETTPKPGELILQQIDIHTTDVQLESL